MSRRQLELVRHLGGLWYERSAFLNNSILLPSSCCHCSTWATYLFDGFILNYVLLRVATVVFGHIAALICCGSGDHVLGLSDIEQGCMPARKLLLGCSAHH